MIPDAVFRKALAEAGGHRRNTAKALGCTPLTVYRYIKRLNLSPSDYNRPKQSK